MGAILAMQGPSQKDTHTVEQATELVRRISEQDLPCEFVLGISDETVRATYQLIGDSNPDPLVEQAQWIVDQDFWDTLLSRLFKTNGQCDSSLGGEFL